MSNRTLGCLTILVVLVVLLVAAFVALDQWNRSQPPDAWKNRDASIDAYRAIQRFVSDRLKAPASAAFPDISYATPYATRRQHINRIGASQRYRITSWVDAQNTFGATLRTPFTGEIEQTAKGKWRLLSLQFDD